MAGVFRFSNAVSDIGKFIITYKELYKSLKDRGAFTHDDATETLINKGLVSSSGAIGEEAIKRSRREDRSRDPLFNQLKMYSEIYRMLGWYKPATNKSQFLISEYGEYIFESNGDPLKKLFELNVLHIVSPNPLVEIRGRNILRPFPLIIKLMERLGGILHRDEIILTVLACPNDRDPCYVEKAVCRISALRGDSEKLEAAYKDLMKDNHINSTAVLRNYTRFILASIKWLGWANRIRRKGIYGEGSAVFYEITNYGKTLAKELESTADIRYADIERFEPEVKAAFSVWAIYKQLSSLGYDISDVETQELLKTTFKTSEPIIKELEIEENSKILFFPYQEVPLDIMELANKIAD